MAVEKLTLNSVLVRPVLVPLRRPVVSKVGSFESWPIILIDIDGYWQPLLTLIDHVIEQGFATAASRRLFTVVSEVDEVLDCIAREPLPAVPDAPALI